MRAIHPLNPLKIIPACSGGRRPSSEDDGAGRNASRGALGGHFRRRRLWSAMVVMVVVDRWRQIILIPTRHSYILDSWPPETNFTDLAKKSCCACGAYAPPITVFASFHHGQLGLSLTFPPLFFSYSPTGSTWLMRGVEFCSVPGLRVTSQNILWSTTKVNEACARPPHIRWQKLGYQPIAHTEL